MCKVSVIGSVRKILSVLTQSHYLCSLVQRQNTLSTDAFLATTESYYYRHFTTMSFDHAYRLFGNVIALFPDWRLGLSS